MKRALISVTDKAGVVEFARGLVALGYQVLSTGGTRKALVDGGVPAVEVAEYTGSPEMLDGRVKTLHPKVHGGLLGRRDDPAHVAAMAQHGIGTIDVLCVNLYRFRETLRKPGVTRDEVVENIDIGGPAMIRSAAKNHSHVAVVVDPADYARVLDGLRAGAPSQQLLRSLAAKAYAHTAAYDSAIAAWLDGERREVEGEPRFPTRFSTSGEKLQDLRYGENPHQSAAFYACGDAGPTLAGAKQLCGKELSYNNILDADGALALACEFREPVCVVVKHNNPCGVATASTLERAWELALASDPVSAFGGILAINRPLDVATAQAIVKSGNFLEVLVAPEVPADALAALQQAKWGQSVRVLALGGMPVPSAARTVVRQVSGGLLLQDADAPLDAPRADRMTKRAPTAAETAAMDFAWLVCKHVKSNAIVLARDGTDGTRFTVGIGAGQMSRVDSSTIACAKAGERARGAVVASDAFFPFPDGLEVCARAGVTAAIQPGGSKRDGEVVAAAEAHGMAMVATGRRHFRH